jgi:hypothetical protein
MYILRGLRTENGDALPELRRRTGQATPKAGRKTGEQPRINNTHF